MGSESKEKDRDRDRGDGYGDGSSSAMARAKEKLEALHEDLQIFGGSFSERAKELVSDMPEPEELKEQAKELVSTG